MIKTVTCQVAGLKHEARGTPCQDAAASFVSRAGTAIAISDGAGSRSESHHGSRVAVQAAVRAASLQASAADPKAGVQAGLTAAREAIEHVADTRGLKPDDVAATLSVATISDRWVTVGSVGDGVHLVRLTSGELVPAAVAPASEFANLTTFLTSFNAVSSTEYATFATEEVESVLLSSDGLDPLLLRGPLDDRFGFEGVAHAVLDMAPPGPWRQEHYERLLVSDRFRAKTDDDCSLAVARIVRPSSKLSIRLGDGSVAHLAREWSWSPDHRAWALNGCAGRHVIVCPELSAKSVTESLRRVPKLFTAKNPIAHVCWPSDVAIGEAGELFGVVVRAAPGSRLKSLPDGELQLRGARLADHIAAAVTALHDAGHAHGALRPDHFVVSESAGLQLTDIIPVLRGTAEDVGERRAADQLFLAGLGRAGSSLAAPSGALG